jgi:ABC-2 type transport system permease protein
MPPAVHRHFWLLWRLEAGVLRQHWRTLRWPAALKTGLIIFFGFVFMAGLYLGTRRTLRYLLHLPDVSPFFVLGFTERLLGMVYLFVFSMVFFSLVPASLGSQYTGKDLVLLHALPLHPQAVFHARFFGAMLTASYVAVVFPVPMLLGTAHVFGGSAAFYLLIPVVLFFFVLTPACLGSIVTLALMRWLPAEKTARLVAVAGMGLVGAMVVLLRLLRPEDLFAVEDTDDLRELLRRVALPSQPYLPSTWAARIGVSLIAGGGIREAAGPLWGLCSLGLGAWALLAVSASGLYRAAWETANLTEHVTWRIKRMPGERVLLSLFRPFHPHTRALVVKDFLNFFRDSSQWSQLILLAALMVVYLYNLANLPFPHESVRNLMAFFNMGMAAFVLAAVSARFAYPAVSLEGRAVWLVYAAPLELRRVVFQKCLTVFAPLFLLATILVSLSNRLLEVSPYIYVLSFLLLACITAVLAGLGIGMGAGMPQFDEESPARIAVSGGAMLYMSVSLVYVGIVLALAARPVYFHFNEQFFGREYGPQAWPYYIAIAFISFASAWLPLRWGLRRLRLHEP